jgi:hypothetical protein
MPFKPNYRMQRADRKRAQTEKQQKKLERRAEKAALRKDDGSPADEPGTTPPDGADDETGV